MFMEEQGENYKKMAVIPWSYQWRIWEVVVCVGGCSEENKVFNFEV